MKNIEPNYDVEFVESDRACAFRMIDRYGCYRSEIINIAMASRDALTTSKLRWYLKWAGFPRKFPH